jgi:exodeoxyribonuclease VII small subunit
LATIGDGANPQPLAFEDALAMLDEIVCELEDGRIGLAEALARYEQGVKRLARQLRPSLTILPRLSINRPRGQNAACGHPQESRTR